MRSAASEQPPICPVPCWLLRTVLVTCTDHGGCGHRAPSPLARGQTPCLKGRHVGNQAVRLADTGATACCWQSVASEALVEDQL